MPAGMGSWFCSGENSAVPQGPEAWETEQWLTWGKGKETDTWMPYYVLGAPSGSLQEQGGGDSREEGRWEPSLRFLCCRYTHPFVRQVFLEGLLCAERCPGCWGQKQTQMLALLELCCQWGQPTVSGKICSAH